MKKNKRYGSQYLVAAGISLLLLTAVFQLSARTLPGFGTWYAHHIYSWIVKSVGRLTGLLPFSVVEMGGCMVCCACCFWMWCDCLWRQSVRNMLKS